MSKVDCKVVLLGSADVGKTCLLERYIHGHFVSKTSTVGILSYYVRAYYRVLQKLCIGLSVYQSVPTSFVKISYGIQ